METEDYEYRRSSIYQDMGAMYPIKNDWQISENERGWWPGTEWDGITCRSTALFSLQNSVKLTPREKSSPDLLEAADHAQADSIARQPSC
jgi:hypothetical protein